MLLVMIVMDDPLIRFVMHDGTQKLNLLTQPGNP